jgi:GTPase
MDTINNIYNVDFTSITSINPENDEGNIEYKYKLTNLTSETISKRMTQMKFRINEGNGEAFYFIGVMDNGTLLGLLEAEYTESVKNLYQIATNIECFVTKLSESIINGAYIGEFLIREADKNNYVDLKIGVAGNVDAGKSTTIGTLTKNISDDGRGKARVHVFNYKHEIETGRTSSIGHQIMGFDIEGKVVSTKSSQTNTWLDVVNQSSKIVSFFDLAGHEKYLRTTIYGLTSMYLDYCLIMVGANMGVNHMTREHMSLCLTLKIPFIIIVSKIDIVPENILEETMKKINNICKNGANKVPYNVKTKNDVLYVAKNIKNDAIIPIIQISNVTSFNLDLLKFMLNLLPVRNDFAEFINKPVELLIDNTYSVTGHSTIVSGMLRSGTIKINDIVSLGPFYDESYKQVKVRSIHCKYKNIKSRNIYLYKFKKYYKKGY